MIQNPTTCRSIWFGSKYHDDNTIWCGSKSQGITQSDAYQNPMTIIQLMRVKIQTIIEFDVGQNPTTLIKDLGQNTYDDNTIWCGSKSYYYNWIWCGSKSTTIIQFDADFVKIHDYN